MGWKGSERLHIARKRCHCRPDYSKRARIHAKSGSASELQLLTLCKRQWHLHSDEDEFCTWEDRHIFPCTRRFCHACYKRIPKSNFVIRLVILKMARMKSQLLQSTTFERFWFCVDELHEKAWDPFVSPAKLWRSIEELILDSRGFDGASHQSHGDLVLLRWWRERSMGRTDCRLPTWPPFSMRWRLRKKLDDGREYIRRIEALRVVDELLQLP